MSWLGSMVALAPLLASGTAVSTAAPPQVCRASAIELTPDEVGSTSSTSFSTLPTQDPARFQLGGRDVRRVDFDRVGPSRLAAGTRIVAQYARRGVTMNGIRIADDVWQGPASPPNATWNNDPQIFSFTVPVVAAGIVNTSPDQDVVQLWSGPDGTGTLLLEFSDQARSGPDSSVDRFVGGRVCEEQTIGSMVVINAAGDLELDDLVFEVASQSGAATAGPHR